MVNSIKAVVISCAALTLGAPAIASAAIGFDSAQIVSGVSASIDGATATTGSNTGNLTTNQFKHKNTIAAQPVTKSQTSGSGKKQIKATATSSGSATFTSAGSGSYELGLQSAEVSTGTVAGYGSATADGSFVYDFDVTGKPTDLDLGWTITGAGNAGDFVTTLVDETGGPTTIYTSSSLTAGDSGKFEITNLKPGTYELETTDVSNPTSASVGPPTIGADVTSSVDGNFTFAAVPEPATWAMMMFGLFGIGATLRSRRAMKPAAAAV